jgi:hypothetical protein
MGLIGQLEGLHNLGRFKKQNLVSKVKNWLGFFAVYL